MGRTIHSHDELLESRPTARRDGLLLREIDDELVIYDETTHRAHCLNATAVLVWRSCDGERTVAELARLIARETGLPEDEAPVLLALRELATAGLLGEEVQPADIPDLGRREALRRLGRTAAAAVLLPAVVSIVSPTPAEAASCLATDAACTSSSQCCSGLCLPSGKCA